MSNRNFEGYIEYSFNQNEMTKRNIESQIHSKKKHLSFVRVENEIRVIDYDKKSKKTKIKVYWSSKILNNLSKEENIYGYADFLLKVKVGGYAPAEINVIRCLKIKEG